MKTRCLEHLDRIILFASVFSCCGTLLAGDKKPDALDLTSSKVAVEIVEGIISTKEKDDAIELLTDVADQIRANPDLLKWESCSRISRAWGALGEEKNAAVWSQLAYDAGIKLQDTGLVTAAKKYKRLNEIAELMSETHLIGKYSEFKEAANVFVELSTDIQVSVADHKQTRLHGAWFAGERTSQVLQDALENNANQSAVASIARTLSWSRLYQGNEQYWLEYLDTKVEASSGDTKADWLAARAYAISLYDHSVAMPRRTIATLDGEISAIEISLPQFDMDHYLELLDEAEQAAVSTSKKLDVVGEKINTYRMVSRERDGQGYLKGLSGRIDDMQWADELDRYRDVLAGSRRQKIVDEIDQLNIRIAQLKNEIEQASESDLVDLKQELTGRMNEYQSRVEQLSWELFN